MTHHSGFELVFSLKNKMVISLLTLLIFIGQVTASVIPCQMDMQNQSNPLKNPSSQSQMMDHSGMDHATMAHSMVESVNTNATTGSMNMDCCDNQSNCSMGGCFSMLASFNLLSINHPVTSWENFQAYSFSIKKIPNSLYRPPISN